MINWKKYDYQLPKQLLAQKPTVPRDFSRLFIYDTKNNEIIFDHFYNLDKYLPKNSFLFLNNTKVIPVRITLIKESGGKVIVLLLINEFTSSGVIKMMVDRKVRIGDKLFVDGNHYFQVVNQKEKIFYLSFNFSRDWLLKKLIEIGKTPVPLYLRKTSLRENELRKKYQTVFATWQPKRLPLGSVAAPTASLHFSNRVFRRLENKGISKFFITLHVGLGTFAPITEKNLKEKKLHEEYYEINKDLLKLIEVNRNKGKKLVAVGTTVVRTLESLAKYHLKSQNSKLKTTSQISKLFNKTDLFIFSPYNFKMVDCLITNFHLPKSSLMMLVEAFLQFKGSKKKLIDLYQIAIKEKFRFYSFGDAMMIK